MRRLIDVLIAAFTLAALSPLLFVLVMALRCTGEHKVLYRQARVGRFGQTFHVYKFATMLENSPNMSGREITTIGDVRVLPLGRFLRRSKLNELPQFINVLKGEMTLVGPRPLMEVSYRQYPIDVRQMLDLALPGITGMGSLMLRDEDLLVTAAGGDPREFYRTGIFPYKAALETWYQGNRSTAMDATIVVLTLAALAFPVRSIAYRLWPGLPPEPDAIVEARIKAKQHLGRSESLRRQ